MAERGQWHLTGREPTLEDLLSEPIVIARMRCDGVELVELQILLGEAAQRLTSREVPRPLRKVA